VLVLLSLCTAAQEGSRTVKQQDTISCTLDKHCRSVLPGVVNTRDSDQQSSSVDSAGDGTLLLQARCGATVGAVGCQL